MQISIAAADSVEMKALQHVVESLETRLQDALMQAILQVLESLGKEAAARVIMAERKASIMEQEHISTKQQALAMILRMKHSSDSMVCYSCLQIACPPFQHLCASLSSHVQGHVSYLFLGWRC